MESCRIIIVPLYSSGMSQVMPLYKKAWGTYQLLVPLFKVFALPTQSRTSNEEAHADMIVSQSDCLNEAKQS